MKYLPVSGLPLIEPEEADPEVAQLYGEIQREIGTPFVLNSDKAIAVSPGVLAMHRDIMRTMNNHISFPQPLVAMIFYSIANARNCKYCSVGNQAYCRVLGIEPETLERLAHDLGNVTPIRLRMIIQFAIRCALEAESLTAEDYDLVRAHGVSDEDLVQVMFLASMANFDITMANSLKINPEQETLGILDGSYQMSLVVEGR